MIASSAVNIRDDEVERSTGRHQVGNLLAAQHLVHRTDQRQTHRAELQPVGRLVPT